MIKAPRDVVPLLFTAIFILIFFLVFLALPAVAPGAKPLLVSELLQQYELTGSYDQRTAFSVSVLALVVLSVGAFLIGKRGYIVPTGTSAVPTLNGWIAFIATIAGLWLYTLLIQKWIVAGAALMAFAFFLFAAFGRRIGRRPLELLLVCLIGAYLAVVIVPGLLVWPIPLIAGDPVSLAQVELHLNALVQPGSSMAAGQNYLREIPYSYGVMMPSIVSVIDHHFGMTVGSHLRFVQFCQAAFALVAVGAYFAFRPRNYLGIAVATLLAAPYWISGGLGIWHPNQTGMRSLTFPMCILALTLAGRYWPQLAGFIIGAVGMAALLINVETTIAVGAGVLIYFILRTRGIPFVPIVQAIIGAALAFAGYLVCVKAGLGRLPFSLNPSTLTDTFNSLTSGSAGERLLKPGYWGEGYYLVPFIFVMFLHAAYVVIAAFLKLGSRQLSHRQALKPAIATMLIVWLSYYFNMPNWWQLWTHLFLYGFLLIDLFDFRLFGITASTPKNPPHLFQGSRLRTRLFRAIPIFLLSIVVIHTNSNLVYYTREFLFPYWYRNNNDAAVVSDVIMPRALADALSAKAKFLTELDTATGGKVRYLSYNIEFIPMLTRHFEQNEARNLWGLVLGDAALDPAIDRVFATRPAAILVDTPDGPLAVDGPRKSFQERVRKSVSREYRLDETKSGWQIWRPKAP